MKCGEVERELALPTGSVPQDDLKSHLDACAACTKRAREIRYLDEIWCKTSPPLPTPERWELAWDRIENARSLPPVTRTLARRTWGAWSPAVVAMAATALLALGLGTWTRWRGSGGTSLAVTPAATALETNGVFARLDIPVGQTILYRVDERRMEIIQTNEAGQIDESLGFYGPDEFLAFYGLAEFLPDLVASNATPRPGIAGETTPQ